jgi:hypothetical protein
MVKHIVIWRLKERAADRSKSENASLIKERLESLRGKIPGLLHLEVGMDLGHGENSGDLALYSEFESRAALAVYRDHPLHKAIMPIVLEARTERRVVDYEV